jgi:hypothetical protein
LTPDYARPCRECLRSLLADVESGVSDTVDALDRDQVILNDVHHPVRADPKSVLVATVEAPRRILVLS